MLKLTLVPAATLFLMTALIPVQAEVDYVQNAKEIVQAADWDKMQTVKLTLDEFSYEPHTLHFRIGQPYKLVLLNTGEKKHYFTAPEFYKSIATRKVQSNKDGEVKAPYFLALEMMANGGQLDLYFVPVKKGTYQVYCTIDEHKEEGMDGVIVVE